MAFQSVYTTDFRKYICQPRTNLKPVSNIPNSPEVDWIQSGDKPKADSSEEEILKKLNALYMDRYVSTYQRHYCQKVDYSAIEHPGSSVVGKIKSILFPNYGKALPPLQTARRLFGFSSKATYRVPLTTNQFYHDTVSYNVFVANEKKYASEKSKQ